MLYTKPLIGDRTPAKFAPSQMDESDAFTESVKKKYPDSEIHPIGHSLGAFLAQYNLIKHNLDNGTTFAAPNLYHSFTGDFKKKLIMVSMIQKYAILAILMILLSIAV